MVLPNLMARKSLFPFPVPRFPQNGKMADDFLSKLLLYLYVNIMKHHTQLKRKHALCCASEYPR